MCIHTYIFAHSYTPTYVHIHTCSHIHTQTYMQAHMYTQKYTYKHIYIERDSQTTHTYTFLCIHTHRHTHTAWGIKIIKPAGDREDMKYGWYGLGLKCPSKPHMLKTWSLPGHPTIERQLDQQPSAMVIY